MCVRACVFYYNTKLWTQFDISGILENRDGSDQIRKAKSLGVC